MLSECLASAHYAPVWLLQTRPEKKHLAQFGLDLIKGEVRNNVQAGVLEPVLAKTKIIQVCTVMSTFACSLRFGHLVVLPMTGKSC